MAGHVFVWKPCLKIIQYFIWPRQNMISQNIAEHVMCVRLLVSLIKQTLPEPLLPIPDFEEPFSPVSINYDGSLPETRKLLFLKRRCSSTQFPEAIRDINYCDIANNLFKFFFHVSRISYVYAIRLGFRFLVRFISSKYISVLLNIFQVFIPQNLKVP